MEFLVVILIVGAFWAIFKVVRKAVESRPPIPKASGERNTYPPQSDIVRPLTGGRLPTSSDQSISRRSTGVWNPPGATVEICGYQITGGMIYTGSRMERVAGYGVEPALIDPELPVAVPPPSYRAEDMPYWPCYSEVSPQARGWQAGSKRGHWHRVSVFLRTGAQAAR